MTSLNLTSIQSIYAKMNKIAKRQISKQINKMPDPSLILARKMRDIVSSSARRSPQIQAAVPKKQFWACWNPQEK